MKRFKQILAVIDAGRSPHAALERAVSLARNNQANLTVVTVTPRVTVGIGMPDGGPISAELQEAATAEAQDRLDEAVSAYRSQITIVTRVLMGTAFLEIIREVLRHGHDLVIKVPEDPSWLERLFGSDDMHLLRKCPCPVWLVKHPHSGPYRRILAAVDVDVDHRSAELATRHGLNVKILELAMSLALSDFAELHIAHAWVAIGESAMRGAFLHRPDTEVISYVEQARQQHGQGLDDLLNEVLETRSADALRFLNPTRHLPKGQAQQEIPRLARSLGADLVVMGTVARTGVAGLFIGNTAEAILEQIDCSVLAVKPEGFETPVSLEQRYD